MCKQQAVGTLTNWWHLTASCNRAEHSDITVRRPFSFPQTQLTGSQLITESRLPCCFPHLHHELLCKDIRYHILVIVRDIDARLPQLPLGCKQIPLDLAIVYVCRCTCAGLL
jgi:hypothetical protein